MSLIFARLRQQIWKQDGILHGKIDIVLILKSADAPVGYGYTEEQYL